MGETCKGNELTADAVGSLDQVRNWMWPQYLNELFCRRARFRVHNSSLFIGKIVTVFPATGESPRGQFCVHDHFPGSRWRRPYIETWSNVPEGMRKYDMLVVQNG